MVTGDDKGYVKYWQANMNNVKMFQGHLEAIRGLRYLISFPLLSIYYLVHLFSLSSCFVRVCILSFLIKKIYFAASDRIVEQMIYSNKLKFNKDLNHLSLSLKSAEYQHR